MKAALEAIPDLRKGNVKVEKNDDSWMIKFVGDIVKGNVELFKTI